MIEIENKEELLQRINRIYRKPGYRLGCPFCFADSSNFTFNNFLVQFDGQSFVQFFCKTCGYSMFLNYNVLMKDEEGGKK